MRIGSTWRFADVEHVDPEIAHEAQQLRLPTESADRETDVSGVGRKLAEGRIHSDPIPEIDFGPRVVVKLPVHISETGGDARRQAEGARHCDVELRVLVTVTDSRFHHL